MKANHSPTFRPDIEGLRGVAITSVVLFHAGSLLPGGLSGVDMFFVISGFLITGILLREYHSRGQVDLAGFWARRARRILPAATVVALTTALLAPWLVSPLLLKHVGRDIVAAGYFGLNWRAASRAVDYSAPGDDASPVLHFWSLAVEEQFYLVWPLLLAVLFFVERRAGMRRMLLVAGAAALALMISYVYCGILTAGNQPLAFFGTVTRLWQLLAGAGLAMLLAREPAADARIAAVAGPLGLVAILTGFLVIDPESGFPGWIAALPVAGTVALIYAGAAGAASNLGSRLLSIPPLTYAGRISYSWYLWHWPIFYFGAAALPQSGGMAMAWLGALSFVAAMATHHLLENPVRFHPALVGSRTRSLVMGVSFAGLTVLAGFVVTEYARTVAITLSTGQKIVIEDVMDDKSPAYRSDCHLAKLETAIKPCLFGQASAKPEAVLFGNSHAAHFFSAVEAAAIKRGTAFLMRSKSSCGAIDGPTWDLKFKRRYFECESWKSEVLNTIRAVRPKLVIISSANMNSMVEPGANTPAPESVRPMLYRAALREMIGKLLQSTNRVVLIKDTPRLPEEPLHCLYRNPGNEAACAWPLAQLVTQDQYVPDLREFGDRVKVVDLDSKLCGDGTCRAISDGMLVFRDQAHITASYSMKLTSVFEALLKDAGI